LGELDFRLTQLKPQKMMSSPISRSNASRSYPLSTNLSIFWIPPKVVKEQASQFTSALLHEIRNPLTNINLAMETLKLMIPDDAHGTYLDIIKRASGRINELVSDLLVSSPLNDMEPSEHSIHQLLDEVLVMTEDRLRLKNITVCRAYDKQDHKIVLNKKKVKIALANIIINAIDAMPSENGQLNLITRSENGKYVLEIQDNGIGISKEHLGIVNNTRYPFIKQCKGGCAIRGR
jgi:signal transduction histidine kinase